MAAKETDPKTSVRTIDGKTQTLTEWADELGISPVLRIQRVQAGWSVRDAYTKTVRGGLVVRAEKIARPHRFHVKLRGKTVETYYRKSHAVSAMKEDGRKGLVLVEIEAKATSVGAGLRLAADDKTELMQAAEDANMSFSLFLVRAGLAAARAGTYRTTA